MLFEIYRSSDIGSRKKTPCKTAFKTSIPNWHIRTVSEEIYNQKFAKFENGPWKEYGTNHQITPEGYIKRQEGTREIWAVNIESLDDLLKLIDTEGSIILSPDTIEIYDDYRE